MQDYPTARLCVSWFRSSNLATKNSKGRGGALSRSLVGNERLKSHGVLCARHDGHIFGGKALMFARESGYRAATFTPTGNVTASLPSPRRNRSRVFGSYRPTTIR